MSEDEGWAARLGLRFALCGARTELVAREHQGPLRVQRPFHPEPSGVCHVYVLHPPGGVVGGDTLAVAVELEAGAHALLTTPAAGKLYRSAGRRAQLRQTFQVGRGACLEWLPQETIAFSGAHAEIQTEVQLQAGARFVGWEILCLGRPAAREAFERGEIAQRFEVYGASREPLYAERGQYRAGSPVLHASWGLRGQPVLGSFVCVGADLRAAIPQLREALGEEAAPALAAISCWGPVTVARYVGPSTERARASFSRLWQQLRPLVCGQPACPPRIWAT